MPSSEVFKTTDHIQFIDYFSKVEFPEFQAITKMVFDNKKEIKFLEFQVYKEMDTKKGDLLSYNIDILNNDNELPILRIWGAQRIEDNVAIKITLDYMTLDGELLQEYTLFQDGQVYLNEAIRTK